MLRLLPIAPYLAIAALAVAVWWLWDRNGDIKDDLRAKEIVIERQKHAQTIHRKYIEETEAIRAENDALRNELSGLEGGDAVLSDYLGAVSRRVWP